MFCDRFCDEQKIPPYHCFFEWQEVEPCKSSCGIIEFIHTSYLNVKLVARPCLYLRDKMHVNEGGGVELAKYGCTCAIRSYSVIGSSQFLHCGLYR